MTDSPYMEYWKNSISLTPVHSFSGYSRGAENTGFYCKELDLAFDAGLQTNDVPAVICLTHLHTDHACNLNKMLIENSKNPLVIIPDNDKFEYLLVETLKLLYLSSKFIHPSVADPKRKYPYRIVRLKVGESYQIKELKKNGEGIYVEGLPSDHGVVSLSFGVYELRSRLKPEYQDLEQSKYKELAKKKIEFTELYKFPIVCYMSDTSIKPFTSTDANSIFQYPTIVTECTFLKPDDLKKANKKKHIHWEKLEPIIRSHPNRFVITHFSQKYTWPEVSQFFEDYTKQSGIMKNLVVWVHTGVIDYDSL